MDEPMEIVDAREVLQDQTRFRLALGALAVVGGPGGAALGLLGVDPSYMWGLVFLTLVGALAVSGVYLPRAERWKNAESKLALWKKQGTVASTPEDPRLVAAGALLARISEIGADVDGTKRVAALAESRLRALLTDLGVLEASVAAEAALGDDPRHTALGEARSRKSAEVTELLGSLRELHAGLTLREVGGAELASDVEELLQRLGAEAEVNGSQVRQRQALASRSRVAE
jgi:hypothetical protein